MWNVPVPFPRAEALEVTCRAGFLFLQKADFLAEEDQTSVGKRSMPLGGLLILDGLVGVHHREEKPPKREPGDVGNESLPWGKGCA